jgi:Spy/CpxP family protein refolding chaperone
VRAVINSKEGRNMRWSNLAGSVAALLVGVAVAGVSVAQPPFGGPHRDRGPGRFIEENATQLGLDDETREAIETIVDESRDKAQEIRAEIHGLHREIHALLSQETPREAAVMQQAEAIGKAETKLHKHRLGTLIKIRALLTPEQREELMQIREESRARWIEPMKQACEVELENFCSDDEDRWSQVHCMREHFDELSADCQDAIEDAKRARHGFRRGSGRRGMGGF